MREMDAFEQAYKNGFAAGMKAAEEKIVHCRECKYRSGLIGRPPFMFYICNCDEGLTGVLLENNFCSYGERREDG